MTISALRNFHTKLIGPVDATSIQARIFHEVSLLGIIAIPISLIVNLFIGVPYVNGLLAVTFLCISGLYYNSRYLGNLKSSVFIFTVTSNLLLTVNYCFNSGIAGPTLLLFLLSVVFTVAVSPSRKSLFWIILNACFVAVMLYVEYINPKLIKNTYANREGFFVDTYTSYLAVIACIIIILSYLVKSQEREKMKAINASKALREANDSKTKLLSILSHDLRSPLNSIQTFLEILVDFDLEEEERKAINRNLLKETKSTQNMLFNLLSWTKAQMEGGMKVDPVAVSYYEVMDLCIEGQRSAATEKTIDLHSEIDRELIIVADLDMLKLVVRNILNNAIKFTKPGGRISVSSERTETHGVLIITDDGIGIDERKAENLFTMNSVSTYGTSNEKGVGLGLLLCKEFTEMQGGRIALKSTPGEGTSFYLHFPLHQQ